MTTSPGTIVQRRRARQTGRVVLVRRADYADEGWETICEDHGFVCSHETRALAISFAASPEDWCEICSGAYDPDETF